MFPSRTTINDYGQQPVASPSTDGQASNAWHTPAPATTSIGVTSTSVPETARSPAPLQPQQQQQALPLSPLPPTAQTQTQTQQPQFPPGVKLDAPRPPSALQQQPQQPPTQRNAFPGSLSDLVASFENVKQKGGHFTFPLGVAQPC